MRPVGLKAQHRAGLRREAGGVAAGGLLPPGVGVTEDLNARDEAGEGDALPVVVGGGGHRAHAEHQSGGDRTRDGSEALAHTKEHSRFTAVGLAVAPEDEKSVDAAARSRFCELESS